MTQDLSGFKPPGNRGILKNAEKRKGGRPPKEKSDRMTEKVTLNFTEEEKEKLLEHAKKKGIPITVLIRTLLAENDYI